MPKVATQDHVDEVTLKTAVWSCRMIMAEGDENHNKFWHCWILSDGRYVVENGRVGVTCNQQPAKRFGSVDSAIDYAKSKQREKENKGYKPQRTIAGSTSPGNRDSSQTPHTNKRSLLQIAMDQIKGPPEIRTLVQYLVDANIHNITSNTKITFDESNATFRTPLGLVEASAIIEARQLLNKIADHVANRDTVKKFGDLIDNYCMIIPQNLGMTRGWHEIIFSDMNKVKQQNDILDSLDASLQAVMAVPDNKAGGKKIVEQVFNVELTTVTDRKIFDAVSRKYEADKGNHYDVKDLRLKSLWTIHILTVREAFRKHGMSIGNVMQLWHGTKSSNTLSVLRSGLICPPQSSPHVTGRMFGDRGIYFSDQSSKSLRYATNAWTSGGRTDRTFMFLADVAMGKYHIPSGPTSSDPPAGYYSYFAKGGQSGVANNEMIVFKTHQIDLTYLCEFGR